VAGCSAGGSRGPACAPPRTVSVWCWGKRAAHTRVLEQQPQGSCGTCC
jgi:hypothetical protein